jgi:CheY-like chemotaxis protein
MSGPRRLLLVEDDDGVRDMMEMVLDSEGYEVVTATNGHAALAVLDAEPPDLILLDMRMPEMDGWEFARRYAQLPGPKPPIIVVTAAQDASRRAAEIAAHGYLAKPFGIDDLLQVIDQHLPPCDAKARC